MEACIGCQFWGCEERATVGGIYEHNPRPATAIYPVYYFCSEHAERTDGAVETWSVS